MASQNSSQTAASHTNQDLDQQPAGNRIALEGISELVFLDRYARKDPRKDVAPGDLVITLVKDDPRFPQREIGYVRSIDGDRLAIELKSSGELIAQDRKRVDKPLELTPAAMWNRMARAVVAAEDSERQADLEQEFRWLLHNFRFCPGGRINAMLGTAQNLTAYNCYVVPMRANSGEAGVDSRQAIIDTLGNMVEIMSRGGGVGINLSSLRPRLSYVSGVNGRSSGSVSWGALFSFATGLVEQGGSRRGALMLILEDWHPDLLEFIKAKRDLQAITNANISVGISHAFMKAVRDDADWHLVFPDTKDPDYDALWDGNMKRWRDEHKKPVRLHRTLKAREIWKTITESAWMSGEPGVVFLERMNEYSNSWYYNDLISTNPCFAGSTRLATSVGYRTFEELYRSSEAIEVLTDVRVSHLTMSMASTTGGSDGAVAKNLPMGVCCRPALPVFRTRRNAPVYRLHTAHGYELVATEDHLFLTPNGWTELRSLERGQILFLQSAPGAWSENAALPDWTAAEAAGCERDGALLPTGWSQELGQLLGWLMGKNLTYDDSGRLTITVVLDPSEQELVPRFQSLMERWFGLQPTVTVTCNTLILGYEGSPVGFLQSLDLQSLEASEKRLPNSVWNAPRHAVLGFLQGMFTSEGSLSPSGGGSVRLPAFSKRLLQDVQLLLLNLGIVSRVCPKYKQSGAQSMSSEDRRSTWELTIDKENLERFSRSVGFLTVQKRAALDELLGFGERLDCSEHFVTRVTSVEFAGYEDVYDTTEPETHSIIANGIVAHQCAEQPLPAWAVCNLGHINLSQFVVGPIGKAEVDWESLRRAVHLGVRFLDNVIDITPYFFDQNEQVQKDERRVGMGTMGLGEMLIRLGKRYGSTESLEFIDTLYEFVASEAYLASADLAAEKGAFPHFDSEKYLQGKFVLGLPERVRAAIAKKGMRNVCVLTQAPTGSTGTMVGTSTGIEPYYSWTYWRKGRLGVNEVRERIVEQFFAEHPEIETKQLSNLPPYFVTAMELVPREHIQVQAAIQRWTDSSISKTANAPNHYTVEQTQELYEYAYEMGCKGVTFYRDGSRDEQVLTKKNENETKPTDTAASEASAPVPMSQLGANGRLWRGRPQKLAGATYEWPTPLGKAFITVNDYDGEPIEVFINIGKAGSDISAMSEALGRLATLFLKHAGMKTSDEKVQMLVKHLSDIGGSTSVGFGANRISSVPDALAKTLKVHVEDSQRSQGVQITIDFGAGTDLCPTCGIAALVREEGCFVCKACGYSKC